MSEYPIVKDVISIIFDALHEHYDATTDASSNLIIQRNMNPDVIDIHDVLSDYHLSITVVGEDWEY
jgi:hypothetical protein